MTDASPSKLLFVFEDCAGRPIGFQLGKTDRATLLTMAFPIPLLAPVTKATFERLIVTSANLLPFKALRRSIAEALCRSFP